MVTHLNVQFRYLPGESEENNLTDVTIYFGNLCEIQTSV